MGGGTLRARCYNTPSFERFRRILWWTRLASRSVGPAPMLDIHQIREILPHRYPLLLVDRIDEMDDDHVIGVKNVSANEPYFQGHFPDFPVMPGVLVIETMAQVGAVWLLSSEPATAAQMESKLVLFTSIEQAKFRKPVFPGDELRIEMKLLKRRSSIFRMSGKATVNGKLVAEAVLMCQTADKSAIAGNRQPPSTSNK